MTITPLRWLAVGIAVLAVLDPAVTSARPARPLVAVLHGDGRDQALASRVSRSLQSRFNVVRGPSDAASAVVLATSVVPDEVAAGRVPVFGVLPTVVRPDVRITRVDVPRWTTLNARAPIRVQATIRGGAGRELVTNLSSDGLVVARQRVVVPADSISMDAPVDITPGLGLHLIRVTSRVSEAKAADTASVLLEVRDERLPVLFFDARPSWNSTFVRRVLERDARFSVAHRVVTSRGLANTAGAAPATLSDAGSLGRFATIVVGAPDELSERSIDGLQAFMRRRGGRVVLLMEDRSSPAIDRLAGASRWNGVRLSVPASITDEAHTRRLRGRELFWPSTRPPGAAVIGANVAADSARRPIIWSVPVGAGLLVVSGAIDAWQFRDDSSGFSAFWSSVLADLSYGAPPPIELQLDAAVLSPGQRTTVRATVREPFLADGPQTARLNALLVSETDSMPMRLWPAPTPGVFTGSLVAPRRSGTYRLQITSGSERATAPLMVDFLAAPPAAREPDVVSGFVSSRGGRMIPERNLDQLPGLVASAVESVSRVETWYPMRSAWWMVPFALLLGAEWWWRRRSGLA